MLLAPSIGVEYLLTLRFKAPKLVFLGLHTSVLDNRAGISTSFIIRLEFFLP